MKKITLLLIVLLFLTSCAHKTENVEQEYFFLFATPLKNHVVWQKAEDGFNDACRDFNIECQSIGPTNIDTERMNEVVETAILMKVDGIITQGVIDTRLINEAKEAGIPLILIDSDQSDSGRFAFMGKDFAYQAELLLEDVKRYYADDEKIVIAIQVAEKQFKIAQDQIAEIENVFARHPGGFEIVSISDSKSDVVRAKMEWNKVFEEHPDIKVAINFAGESAIPCFEASKEHNIKDILIYGVDDTKDTIEGISKGQIDGSIVTSFYDYGYKSAKVIYDYLESGIKDNDDILYPEIKLIKQESIRDYEDAFK